MAYSYVEYPGNGSQTVFNVPFPYLSKEHVKVSIDGAIVPHSWDNDSTVRLDFAAASGSIVRVQRETPLELQVDYRDGANLTAADLDKAYLQNLYINQEWQDRYDLLTGKAKLRLAGENGLKVAEPGELVDAIIQEVLNSELAHELNQRIADIDLNGEAILNQHSRIDQLQSQIDALANIDGTGLSTFILNEQEERIAADEAFAADLALLGAKSPDGSAWVLSEDRVLLTSGESLANRFAQLQAEIGQNSADILNEQQVRATEVSALAEELHLLGAQNAAGSAFVLDQDSVLVDEETSLATRLSGLDARIGEAEAEIASEQNARVAADAALADDIQTLRAEVDGNYAAIQTKAEVSAVDNLESRTTDLEARYSVKVDLNGYVTGFGLAATENDGEPTSEFIVKADRFLVVDPNNGLATPTVPFAVANGIVKMQNVVVENAVISNLSVSKLINGTLNADMNVGTGRIIWSNGTYMKVAGVGFGSANQFIEWFGPASSNLNNCKESNAIYYLKTNGDAYFGGNLTAGTLHNAIQSTSLASNAQAILGPYTSNGGPKQIVVSYSGGNPNAGSGYSPMETSSSYATVRIERRIGTGSWTTLTTRTFTGGVSSRYIDTGGEPGVHPYWYRESVGGAYSFTDSVSPSSERSYRVTLIDRSFIYTPSYQTISITSTEE